MLTWLRELDELLRGQKTQANELMAGRLRLPLRRFVTIAVLLGALYGFFMGWFAVFSRTPPNYPQVLASTLKLPALFLLTLVVTFPSLYVFNALVGCRLTWNTTLRLLVGAVVVNLAIAASFGPILGFFTFSTESYPFIVLLNVILLGLAGIVALSFLLRVLRNTARHQALPPPTDRSESEDAAGAPLTELDRPPDESLGQARLVFRLWVLIYGLVGAQMGWLLRPFIGAPELPFVWLRPRSGNFFQAVTAVLQSFFEQ